MFSDNFLVVNLTVIPDGKIQRWSQILNYNWTREYQEKGIIKFVHMNGNDNYDYIMTKSCTSDTWFYLTKPLLFWSDMEFLKEQVFAKDSKDRPSTPPLSLSKDTTQQSFKLDLLGD